MNIAVISPHFNHTGTTTVASLLALELASRGRKVCITNSLPKSESLYKYFGLSSLSDKTINPARLVKMIKEGALKREEVSDYCRAIDNNTEVFCADSDTFTQEDMLIALEFITTSFPHDYVVYDIDNNDLESPANRLILKNTDAIVIVINQGVVELGQFKQRRDKILSAFGKTPQLVVVNKFCEINGSLKETAHMMGIKAPNNWCPIRYNPWIGYGTNNGKVKYIFDKMQLSDYRLADIKSDFASLANLILKVKVAKRQQNLDNMQKKLDTRKAKAGGESE